MTEPIVEERRIIGKIIKLSPKGYGFIISKDIPFTRIFFHWTALIQETIKFTELTTGMEVEFTPKESKDKGTRAIKIDVLEPEHVVELPKPDAHKASK